MVCAGWIDAMFIGDDLPELLRERHIETIMFCYKIKLPISGRQDVINMGINMQLA